MHKELPLYIFVRNTLILAVLFFIISAIIIEHGRRQRGENTLFNGMMLKQKNIIDYNDHDILKSLDSDPINALIEGSDAIKNNKIPTNELLISSTFVKNDSLQKNNSRIQKNNLRIDL